MNLKRARELCEAATPGPWGLDEDVEELGGISGIYYGPDDPPVAELLRADAEFIVAARTLLPAALDRIEAAIAEIEENAPHDESCAAIEAWLRWQRTDQHTPFEPGESCNCWRGRVLSILRGSDEDRN